MRRESGSPVRRGLGDGDRHDLGGRADLGGVGQTHTPATDRLLAYGYHRVGDGSPSTIPTHHAALTELADSLELMLHTVFLDRHLCPELERPAFRTMLDVVRALRPHAVLVPDPWHLAARPATRTKHLREFHTLGCSVLAAHQGKAYLLTPRRPADDHYPAGSLLGASDRPAAVPGSGES